MRLAVFPNQKARYVPLQPTSNRDFPLGIFRFVKAGKLFWTLVFVLCNETFFEQVFYQEHLRQYLVPMESIFPQVKKVNHLHEGFVLARKMYSPQSPATERRFVGAIFVPCPPPLRPPCVRMT